MNWTQSSSALLVLIVLCFHTERTNLFNNRRIGSCQFEELKRFSKHVYQKNTPRTARAHMLNHGTHGFATVSTRVMRKKPAPYPAFHACHSRPLYRYLLYSYSTQKQRKNNIHSATQSSRLYTVKGVILTVNSN